MTRSRIWAVVTTLTLALLAASSVGVDALDKNAPSEMSLVVPAANVDATSVANDSAQSSPLTAIAEENTSVEQHEAASFDDSVAADPLELLETKASSSTQQEKEFQSSLATSVAAARARDDHKSSASSDSALVGVQSAAILVAGAAVLVVLAVAFRRQRITSNNSKKFEQGMNLYILSPR